jgi:hypothetical protein
MKKNWIKKLEKFDRKMEFLDMKFGLIILGFLSALGVLIIAGAFTIAVNYYLFIQSKEYSKLMWLIFYAILTLTLTREAHLLGKYFNGGYLSGVIVFILIFILGLIMNGPKLW